MFVFFSVRQLLRMADVEGALQETAPEIQAALKADGLATKTTLLDRCSTEVVLGKWFVVRVVKEHKVVGLNEENWEFSEAWSALRSAWAQFKGSVVPEPEGKPAAKGPKMDVAKRSKLVKAFEEKYPIPFGSKRTAPGNRLLEKFVDVPLVYVAPAGCTSVLDEESDDKVKAAKLDKVCCFAGCVVCIRCAFLHVGKGKGQSGCEAWSTRADSTQPRFRLGRRQ